MPVQYNRITTNPITIQQIGTTLHQALIAAGWTIEYANADAIGSGSASNPAWSKTPANNTSAGIVIYRMPANGTLFRWYVEIELLWPLNTIASLAMSVRTGTDHTSGTLLNPSAKWGMNTANSLTSNSGSGDNYVCANEDGFLVALNAATTGWLLLLERLRDLTGALQNDLLVMATSNSSNWVQTPNGRVGNAVRRGDAPYIEYTPRLAALLAGQDATSAYQNLVTTTRADGNGFPCGPYPTSNGLWGLPRLAVLMLADDCTLGQALAINVDGGPKNYFCMVNTNIFPSGCRWLVAQE